MRKHYEISGTDFAAAGEASSSFKDILKKLGVPANLVRRVAIAMYEAEINTVIHGGGGVCDAEILDDRIVITFADNGPGIADLDLAMQEGYSTASDQIRELGFGAGMGLPNIKKYSDEMNITSNAGKGTIVTLTIYL
ncbi:MAG: ATP-binding protein [Clostridia bacterium]|nr:ATP-binding protein [Clostridia bacterium]